MRNQDSRGVLFHNINRSMTVGITATCMNSSSDELDHFITGALPVPAVQAVDSSHGHLSYPSLSAEGDSSRRESSSQPLSSPLFKDRIYVGNLHPSVDECASSPPTTPSFFFSPPPFPPRIVPKFMNAVFVKVHPRTSIFQVWQNHQC